MSLPAKIAREPRQPFQPIPAIRQRNPIPAPCRFDLGLAYAAIRQPHGAFARGHQGSRRRGDLGRVKSAASDRKKAEQRAKHLTTMREGNERMGLSTDKRDEALLEDIAEYFDILAGDCEAMARRRFSVRENTMRAKVWREAAADVRSITLTQAPPSINPQPSDG